MSVINLDDGNLKCPTCNGIQLHLENTEQEPINGGRQLELEFSCETCDECKITRHYLQIDSHKGLTNIRWVRSVYG